MITLLGVFTLWPVFNIRLQKLSKKINSIYITLLLLYSSSYLKVYTSSYVIAVSLVVLIAHCHFVSNRACSYSKNDSTFSRLGLEPSVGVVDEEEEGEAGRRPEDP